MIRFGEPPYLECSSKGDKRFSAFHARLRSMEAARKFIGCGMYPWSIEEIYQASKVFADGSTGLSWQAAKGRASVNIKAMRRLYSRLWDQYIKENPELLSVLKAASGLSDMFGQTGHACQAEELWRIRNKMNVKEMSIETESYKQAFGFGELTKAEYALTVNAKVETIAIEWARLQTLHARCDFFLWFRLLFVQWTPVLAPKSVECAVTDMSGFPLYEYKEYKGRIYFLRPQAGFGFPGS
jgi:hypothetical protein